MSTRIPSPWVLLAGSLLLGGCSQDPSSGASTETTNGLFGRLVDSAAMPMADVKVDIWNKDGTALLTSTRTDSMGNWNARLPRGDYGILASSNDTSLLAWKFHERSDSGAISLSLAKASAATIPDAGRLRLLGTPFRAESGRFRRIPAGPFTLASDIDGRLSILGSFFAAPGTDDTLPQAYLSDSGTLLEDFDDGDTSFLFRGEDSTGRWSINAIGLGHFEGATANGSVANGITSRYAWSGNSLKLEGVAQSNTSWLQLSIRFHRPVDMTELRALRLRAKGTVSAFRVSLGFVNSEGYQSASYWIGCPKPDWSQITFKPWELVNYPYSAPWGKIQSKISFLSIDLLGNDVPSTLWLDDIRLYGVPAEAFLP